MGAEAAQAADQVGHRLGAESENAADEHEGRTKKWISEAFHEFALRVQGIDPAQRNAEQEAARGQGLSVQRTDESGQPVQAPPDAGQVPAQPDAQNSPGIP